MSLFTSTTLPGEDPVHQTHAELHHYTGWHGLEGIVRSGQLWATHYSNLNDRTEVTHLRDHLIDQFSARLPSFIQELRKTQGFKFRRAISKAGGVHAVAKDEARKFVDAFYRVTFSGEPSKIAFAEPFITSFCSHYSDHKYERNNGLLSQWRGYGGAIGFAIVFDTVALTRLLDQEFSNHEYSAAIFLDVIYGDDSLRHDSRLLALSEQLEQLFRQYIKTGESDAHLAYNPFVATATRLKHRGFHEEREVRIVASPISQLRLQKLDRLDAANPFTTKPVKAVKTRGQNGTRYISLFETLQAKLPIKRIIVGPHADQKHWGNRARELVGPNIAVTLSETPYITPG